MAALLNSVWRRDGVSAKVIRRKNAAKVDKRTVVFMAFGFYSLSRILVLSE